MKTKIIKLGLITMITLSMASCYTSKVYHGNVTENTLQTKVASKKNQFLIGGLVPLNAQQQAKQVIGDKENYTTVTKFTFVDMLLSGITCGIYTPTTTEFLVPANEK
jgi:hypothetical protein